MTQQQPQWQSFDDIIDYAIENEIAAQKFYLDAAKKMENRLIKEMFLGFVTEEKKHENTLRKLLKSMPEDLPFDESRDYRVTETTKAPEVSPDMKPADAFALAMNKEQEAMNFYAKLAEGCTDPQLKNIFLELASMERQHKFQMEKAFVDTGFPEAW